MGFIEDISSLEKHQKLALGKAIESLSLFANTIDACSMASNKWGLNIDENLSNKNQILSALKIVFDNKGVFLFCINGVDLKKALNGFSSFEDAASLFLITEWELNYIIENEDYVKITKFHNNKVEFKFDKEKIEFIWNK